MVGSTVLAEAGCRDAERSGRVLLVDDGPWPTALDPEDVAARLRRAASGVPYRLIRPWVHLGHRWRVLRAVGGDAAGSAVLVLDRRAAGPLTWAAALGEELPPAWSGAPGRGVD